MNKPYCGFKFFHTKSFFSPPPVTLEQMLALPFPKKPVFAHESEIAHKARLLRNIIEKKKPDSRGLLVMFGVTLTHHLAHYHNRITFETLRRLKDRLPETIQVFEELLREAGQICVFNTFSGILCSENWIARFQHSKTPEETVINCVAIARALGFGRWQLVNFQPNKRLELRVSLTPEAAYLLLSKDILLEKTSAELFLQGATIAIMQLAMRVNWQNPQSFDREQYRAFFKGDAPWKISHETAFKTTYSNVIISR